MNSMYNLQKNLQREDYISFGKEIVALNNDLDFTESASRNDFYTKWLNFLMQDDKINLLSFLNVYKDSYSVIDAIMVYRRNIRRTGRGTINNGELIVEYESGNMVKVKELFEEKCLEYIPDETFNRFLNIIKNKNIKIADLLNEIDEFPNMRLMSFIL